MAEAQDAASAPPAAAPAVESEKKDENWRFIPTQPVREDQVQNAVNFLSHPKVKGSPVAYRRSFLERKGLTKDEIDEAFRRVPDPPSDSKTGQLPAAPPAAPLPLVQQAAPAPQLVSATPQQALVPSRRKGPSWTQLALAIGILSAAGAGAAVATKNYLFPRMKAWLRRIVLDEEHNSAYKKQQAISELEAAKASAANNAVGEMVALVRELMSSKIEERRYFDGVVSSLEAQTRELKLSLEAQTREIKRSLSAIDAHLQKTTSASATVSEANGFSSPDQYKASLYDGQATKVSFGAPEQPRAVRPSSAPSPNNPPHSSSYLEIMAMLERGEKPPNIRDVNDKPPNPNQTPSASVLQPKAKPWESSKDEKAENGPWWQQRPKDKRVENAVKIVEIEAEEGSNSNNSSSSSGMNGGGYEARPPWVPPPVPRTILPGVDAAIRHKGAVIEPENPFTKPAANGESSASATSPETIPPVVDESPITQKVTIIEADQEHIISDKPEDVVVSEKPESAPVSSSEITEY